jgi:hypothetical protein
LKDRGPHQQGGTEPGSARLNSKANQWLFNRHDFVKFSFFYLFQAMLPNYIILTWGLNSAEKRKTKHHPGQISRNSSPKPNDYCLAESIPASPRPWQQTNPFFFEKKLTVC